MSPGLTKLLACAFLYVIWITIDYLKINDPVLTGSIIAALAAITGGHAIENYEKVKPEGTQNVQQTSTPNP